MRRYREGAGGKTRQPSAGEGTSNEYLPESKGFTCGKGNAGMKYSGCCIKYGSVATLRVADCGKECQVKHGPLHKAVCTQAKQLCRAMDLYQRIYGKIMECTFPQECAVRDMREEHGPRVVRVMLECDELECAGRTGCADYRWRTFLRKSCPVGRERKMWGGRCCCIRAVGMCLTRIIPGCRWSGLFGVSPHPFSTRRSY